MGAPAGASVTGAEVTGAAVTGAEVTGAAVTGAVVTGASVATETGALTGAIETGVVIPLGAVATGGSRERVNDAETGAPPEQKRRRHGNAVAVTTCAPIPNSGQTFPAHMAKGADESVKALVVAPL
jgi:hypothetical protein